MDFATLEDGEHPVTGNVVQFPQKREREQHDELSEEGVLRRARFACRVAGLTEGGVDMARVERACREWLAHGVKPHEAIEKAASLAKAMRRPNDDGPRAA